LRPLEKINYVKVLMDSSNRSAGKLVPIVVSYFSIEEEEIQVKLVHFDEVSGECAEILAQ
jgi:hypothetical protein